MKKYKLNGSLPNVKRTRLPANSVVVRFSRSDELPPLSMGMYSFSEKKLNKKKKEIQQALQKAESLMATELGRVSSPKKKNTIGIKRTRFL